MSFQTISNYFQKEITKAISKKPENEWVATLNHKKTKKLYQFVKTIVEKNLLSQHAWLQNVTQSGIDALKHKKKLKDKVKKIQKTFQTQKAQLAQPIQLAAQQPTLFTVRITKEKNCTALQKIIQEWKDKSKLKHSIAKNATVLPAKVKLLAEDSKDAMKMLKEDFPKKSKAKATPYIAYDEEMKIQGIALKYFKKKHGHWVELIATHPDNLVIIGNEAPVRGVGTALMKHMISDMKNNPKSAKKDLFLNAFSSALGFYGKLGFEVDPEAKRYKEVIPLVLKNSKMNDIVTTALVGHAMTNKEPKIK